MESYIPFPELTVAQFRSQRPKDPRKSQASRLLNIRIRACLQRLDPNEDMSFTNTIVFHTVPNNIVSKLLKIVNTFLFSILELSFNVGAFDMFSHFERGYFYQPLRILSRYLCVKSLIC